MNWSRSSRVGSLKKRFGIATSHVGVDFDDAVDTVPVEVLLHVQSAQIALDPLQRHLPTRAGARPPFAIYSTATGFAISRAFAKKPSAA